MSSLTCNLCETTTLSAATRSLGFAKASPLGWRLSRELLALEEWNILSHGFLPVCLKTGCSAAGKVLRKRSRIDHVLFRRWANCESSNLYHVCPKVSRMCQRREVALSKSPDFSQRKPGVQVQLEGRCLRARSRSQHFALSNKLSSQQQAYPFCALSEHLPTGVMWAIFGSFEVHCREGYCLKFSDEEGVKINK